VNRCGAIGAHLSTKDGGKNPDPAQARSMIGGDTCGFFAVHAKPINGLDTPCHHTSDILGVYAATQTPIRYSI